MLFLKIKLNITVYIYLSMSDKDRYIYKLARTLENILVLTERTTQKEVQVFQIKIN